MKNKQHGSVGVMVLCALAGMATSALAQNASEANVPDGVSEQVLLDTIRQSKDPLPTGLSLEDRKTALAERHKKTVLYADTLLKRFPKSKFREEVTLRELQSLAALARGDATFLQRLIDTTKEVSRSHPTGKLASENAFYAVQAFVYGARAEHMPATRLLQGTMERYKAFLDDYPDSDRRSVIYASLIRNYDRAKRFEEGFQTLGAMFEEFPDEINTIRAQDELLKASILGKPFEGVYVTSKGKTVKTSDYKGKILVIHYWSNSNKTSISTAISALLHLYTNYVRTAGIELLGVTLDEDDHQIQMGMRSFTTPWPQCVKQKVSQAGESMAVRIIEPTFLILDREGIVRSVKHDAVLPGVVEKLNKQ